MTSGGNFTGTRLADNTRLTRYAFAMRTINDRSGLLAAMLVVIPSCLLGQQAKTNAVVVVVSDQSGAGISQAQITIVPRPENSPEKVNTDAKGHASLSLKSGDYVLSISAQGFTTATQPVRVSDRNGADRIAQEVKLTLKVGATSSPTNIYPPDSLVVSDPYHAPIVLSLADFRALPHITIKVHNGRSDAEENYSGVLAETLLAKANAPVGKEFRKEALRTYLLASGTDGYSVLLSLAEVDSTFHAGQVIVADTRDGQLLGKNGPFQLIVPGDSRPARWVHNLNAIKLQQAQ
ncbi:MAG TPA: carboxypeptidase regulatory-like domain-containing protein [Verrucomicrobiae bacterium]|nr:carboxypeptidase regulatory-like domain-containing protein [Verrucomicrobiae bacterium]